MLSEPAKSIVSADKERARTASGIKYHIGRSFDTEGVEQVTKILAGEVLPQAMSFFGRDEPLEDGANNVLRQAGKVASIEIVMRSASAWDASAGHWIRSGNASSNTAW